MNKIKMLFVCILLLFSVIGCEEEPKVISKYKVGEMVCLKLNPFTKGQIIYEASEMCRSFFNVPFYTVRFYTVRFFQKKSKTNTHLLTDDGYIEDYMLFEKNMNEFELIKCNE